MAGKYLLDTNIVIAFLDQEREIGERVKQVSEVFLSATVLGELYYGSMNSKQSTTNLDRLERFIRMVSVLSCNAITAKLYGEIKTDLRARGRPIPDNDVWIAASTRQHGLTLATRDAHFENVSNLDSENW
jgi:tRNA(fMet)-specific endonuclease VapC